jgi:hypothetical protein
MGRPKRASKFGQLKEKALVSVGGSCRTQPALNV